MTEKYSAIEREISEKESSIKISNSVFQRLTSGIVNEEICTTDEKCWLDKLVAVDKDHTREAGLHINEIERLLNDIDTYTRTKPRRGCPVDSVKVSDCLKANKGNTLTCEIEVESFKKCIDKSLHAAVDRNMKGVRRSKKGSYLEAFERKYQF